MDERIDYLAEIKQKLGQYKYNEVKYLIGLFGLDCYFAKRGIDDKPDKQCSESLKQAKNLRYAFIEGCNAQMEADKKYGVD